MKRIKLTVVEEIKTIADQIGYNPDQIAKWFSSGRASCIKELDESESLFAIGFLKCKKELIHHVMFYCFQLKVIEHITYHHIQLQAGIIETFLKFESISDTRLLDMDKPEMDNVIKQLHAMMLLQHKNEGERPTAKGGKFTPLSPSQLKCINTLVSKLKIRKDDKEAMVEGFSSSRSISSKDLSFNEATAMIKHLKSLDPNERMIRKVFALAYEANLIFGDTPEDKKMNGAKLNAFLLKNGTVKKHLSEMTSEELVKVVSQFQQIVKHTQESKASKETQSLLSELNITIAK